MKSTVLLIAVSVLLSATCLLAQTRVPASLQKKFPSLKVEGKVGIKRDAVDGSFYMQTMTITPAIMVDSAPTQAVSAMEATMIVIAMDTRAKYTERRDVYLVHAAETVPVAGADRGSKREVTFKPSKTRYDSYRDSSNVGGAVYKWYIFGVRDAETKQLLHFAPNCTTLEKHVNAKPDSRDAFLKLSTGSMFDTNFK